MTQFKDTKFMSAVERQQVIRAWEKEKKVGLTFAEVKAICPEAVESFRETGLVFGKFEEGFLVEGKHYEYGLWANSGDWAYAFDTLEELKEQLLAGVAVCPG